MFSKNNGIYFSKIFKRRYFKVMAPLSNKDDYVSNSSFYFYFFIFSNILIMENLFVFHNMDFDYLV